ncbi:peptide synthase [Nocardioides sp. dk4132]|uniref:condensation domain-containing protein n=1 Tax=unclassified Nocardioides TaxID=2615069 RepID=UPI0012971F44|nr:MULTISPECIES: condensation domain-containing protein [unclassified Nocardioides]MQW75118.1 peptide synthase [Nocardioides sp. dk4132]QGA07715.1 peptide synthase [Nocardioides sp. dk884]
MRVTTADAWELRPGTVLAWRVAAPLGAGTPVDLSPDQRNHLEAAAAGEPAVWITAAFDVDGPIDPGALEAAFRDLVARHGTLQCTASVSDGVASARRHDPATLDWRRRVVASTTTTAETQALVRDLLDAGCDPLNGPALLPAAVSRPDRSTVVLGLDHLHTDATSVAVVVEDLHALYEARRRGGAAAVLPVAGCFVAACAAAAPVAPTDPRLAAWHAVLDGLDHRLPTFPLDLGIAPGERAPQAGVLVPLLDGAAADALDRAARAAGASTCAATLGAFAGAVAGRGGPSDLPVLLPVSTRRTPAEQRAVGWFTATVPLVLRADAAPGETARDLRAARELAGVPLDQVLATLPAPLVRARGDVFMVSWLDYRRLPGHGRARARVAHHVSATTRADDLQLWLSRTDAGLALRARIPATAAARATLDGVVEAWRHRLVALARTPEYLYAAGGSEV